MVAGQTQREGIAIDAPPPPARLSSTLVTETLRTWHSRYFGMHALFHGCFFF